MCRCDRKNCQYDHRAQFRSWRTRIVPSGWRLKNFLREGEEPAWSHRHHRRHLPRRLQGASSRESGPSQSTCLLRFLDSSALRTRSDEVCSVTCAPRGGWEEFSVYFNTVPSRTVSRVRSYAGLVDCAFCRTCCPPATAERRNAAARKTLLVLMRVIGFISPSHLQESHSEPYCV